jgi:ADP-ribosylglycohydrolase
MLGAIAGDMIGSVHEFRCGKTVEFPLFVPQSSWTDDTVLTVAVARHLMHGDDLTDLFHDAVRRHPGAGWGGMFLRWAGAAMRGGYGSFGNGSAMRVSPVGFAFQSAAETLSAAAKSAEVTHNHSEGIKGAQATALAVFLARTTRDKAMIRVQIEERFAYDLSRTVSEIRPDYGFDETCQRTVPEAITCFLESDSYESAVRLAVSLGGDADTLAAIAGGIAQAYYGLPGPIRTEALRRLTPEMAGIVAEFEERFPAAAA